MAAPDNSRTFLENIIFFEMSEQTTRRWVDANPGSINHFDSYGRTLLTTVILHDGSLEFLAWLIDEKGADINLRNRRHVAPICCARTVDVLSFLLDRGADPTVRNNYEGTPLIHYAEMRRVDCVARLLQDHRVVALINVQATIGYTKFGHSALHVVCDGFSDYENSTEIARLLLCHGADPFLRDDRREHTPFQWLPHYSSTKNHTLIALLEQVMAEPRRIYLLSKARHMNDANHAIAKAKDKAFKEGRTRSETMNKMLAETPPYLKERVQGGQEELPRVELLHAQGSENEEEIEKEKQMAAVMKYVLRDESEYKEAGGMHEDVFVELLDMMAAEWDDIRGVGIRGGVGGYYWRRRAISF